MIKKTVFLGAIFSILILNSCNEKKEIENNAVTEQIVIKGENADIKIGDIQFTKSINNATKLIKIENNRVSFNAEKGTDYFNPTDESTPTNSAPILLTKIDNKKPFTFTAKVTPEFTSEGTYTAGVIYIYENDNLYQKLCFEQDERGMHRVVTVKTNKTSDDNNHDVINQNFIYMKISSDGKSTGSYYSLDNKRWQMVRLYQNKYAQEIYLGLSSQSPKQTKNTTVFEDVKIEQTSIKDFRLGM